MSTKTKISSNYPTSCRTPNPGQIRKRKIKILIKSTPNHKTNTEQSKYNPSHINPSTKTAVHYSALILIGTKNAHFLRHGTKITSNTINRPYGPLTMCRAYVPVMIHTYS